MTQREDITGQKFNYLTAIKFIEYNPTSHNYEPSNCRWATNKQQNRNYSKNIDITIDNKTHCLKEWCEILNKKYEVVYQRIRKLNWNPIDALLK